MTDLTKQKYRKRFKRSPNIQNLDVLNCAKRNCKLVQATVGKSYSKQLKELHRLSTDILYLVKMNVYLSWFNDTCLLNKFLPPKKEIN